MKTLGWNCRGLGNQATVRAFQKLLNKYLPDIVFLMETRRTSQEISKLNQQLFHFEGCFATNCEGEGKARKGGLVILWRESMDLTLVNYSQNHMLFLVQDRATSHSWFFTGIYGWPETENKWKTWDLIMKIKRDPHQPWCCMGDFNEIMWSMEKQGGRSRAYAAMEKFRETAEQCELQDLGFSGNRFTWSNGRAGLNNIQARLDRVLANSRWRNMYLSYKVSHLGRYKSDHAPLLMEFDAGNFDSRKEKQQKIFRFESMWVSHPDFASFMNTAWDATSHLESFEEKIKKCAETLMRWDVSVFGNVRKQLRALNEKLERLQARRQDEEVIQEIHKVEEELDEMLKREEIMWQQRSRAIWLKEGDKNTSFFHKKANQRHTRNRITKLKDDNGIFVTRSEELKSVIRDYYINMFRSEGPTDLEEVLSSVANRVTDPMNEELAKPYTEEEVRCALKQMHPTKAPGPDGMNPFFFQKFWNIVGRDVSNTILKILNDAADPSSLNLTNIVLIPKKKHAETLKDFRPISLCNVIFRIITKCIANRLKYLLPSIISSNQSAFIPGRFITDNAMTAFEIFHSMKNKTKGRRGCLAMKLDMSKAYDRVEWNFLEKIMLKMGFCTQWVNLVMRCVRTVSYSVLLNGYPTEIFRPERGLRQGDPLSPYLFLLCADVFSSLLHKAEMENIIHGFKVTKNAPPVSHLFFADDSILFFRSTKEELRTVQHIIHQYEAASGQRVNKEKTELTASRNVPDEVVDEFCAEIGIQRVDQHQKYLGLPTIIGKSKKQVFSNIVDRVNQKSKRWKDKSLTKAGKEIMIKAVLQAIPSYIMTCFLLPNNIIQEIEKAMARFYWGSKDGQHKIHWVGWAKMTQRKEDGGLGFRELRFFNLAMLARQWWRLMNDQNTLVYQILKAKYFPRGNLDEALIGYKPSYLWCSLLKSKELVKEGEAWRVGNGECIRANLDRWIGIPFPRKVSCTTNNIDTELKVSDLINQQLGQWNVEAVNHHFPLNAEQILAMPLSSRLPPDRRVWGFTKSGQFSVRSAYRLAVSMWSEHNESRSGTSSPSNQWKQIWNLKVLPKMKNFIWQACNESLPTLINLVKRGVTVNTTCRICGEEDETQTHLFLQCRSTSRIWETCALRLRGLERMGSVKNFIWCSLSRYPKEFVELIVVVTWNIWNARNKVCLEEKEWNHEKLLSRIQSCWEEVRATPESQANPTNQRKVDTRAWNPPNSGWWKLDSDVAVLNPFRAGLGFVLRGEEGGVILAAKKEICASGNSIMLEGLSMKFALEMIIERGIDHVVVGSDNQGLINAIIGAVSPGEFDRIIVEDIQELAKKIPHISFVFNRREFNCAAHYMARGPDGIYCNETPPQIRHFV